MRIDDEERNSYPEREQHIFNEKLERDEGVLREPQHMQRDCNEPGTECGPDDYPEDPFSIDNRPGTPDDAIGSQGVELPQADDLHLVREGGTHRMGAPAGDERELEPGARDERDLWRRQRALIEEDSRSVRLPEGMTEDDVARVRGAMGDGQGDDASEDVSMPSATGEPDTAEEHGGFPER